MIVHQWLISCDQNPLPNRCPRQIVVSIESPDIQVEILHKVATMNDWGIVNGRHYCPYHRPPPP